MKIERSWATRLLATVAGVALFAGTVTAQSAPDDAVLRAIERATRQPIEQMDLPTVETVNDARIVKFKQTITETLAAGELGLFRSLVEEAESSHAC